MMIFVLYSIDVAITIILVVKFMCKMVFWSE